MVKSLAMSIARVGEIPSGNEKSAKKNVEPSLLEKVDCYPKIEIVGC